MPVLIVAVALVGALCLLNLLFALGVIRRLREQTKLIDALYEVVGDMPDAGAGGAGPAAGDTVADFRATTTAGEPVARDDLAAASVVAFLAADCKGCHEQLPGFLAWARDQDRGRVLAVVNTDGADPRAFVEQLTPVARVVLEGAKPAVARAFNVTSYPQFVVVGPGATVAEVIHAASRLPVGAPA
ncbi:peroxiredoxin family protein [Dactylosporangium matsuzakiense]|uniref:TlpA family protein n=1 Tax=Dactylosporangium matsuzakiense TaxID=53360 RepID=A0A9W6NPZ3_9ACTN|nr:redoxin domain-containing protein [Dactylosporangium matsuzakiense]UWZ41275.1 redoxin domain-containing protein [Dactylosporangium matsuzakiense]GLL05650.1 TlpA family protein [Dactylosporangium matsuzakiense]